MFRLRPLLSLSNNRTFDSGHPLAPVPRSTQPARGSQLEVCSAVLPRRYTGTPDSTPDQRSEIGSTFPSIPIRYIKLYTTRRRQYETGTQFPITRIRPLRRLNRGTQSTPLSVNYDRTALS